MAREWAKKLKAERLPVTARLEYQRQILRFLSQITDDVKTHVIPRLEERDYIADSLLDDVSAIFDRIRTAWGGSIFGFKAKRAATTFVGATAKQASRKFGIDAYKSPRMQKYMERCVALNVQLIKSVAEEHLNSVQTIVMKNVSEGFPPSKMVEDIMAYGVTRSRAALIAYDQTTKILGQTSRIQQEDAGFSYFRWQTSNDERVRHSHTAAQNKMTPYGKGVYRWDELPEVDGEPAFPGSPIRCRCVSIPVADYEVEDFQKQVKK